MSDTMPAERTRMSVLGDMYRGETTFDFRRSWRIGLIASLVLIVISGASLALRGLNLGIDFEGGVSWEVVADDASVAGVRDALRPIGQARAKVQIVGGDTVRVQSDIETNTESGQQTRDEVTAVMAELADASSNDVSVSEVGPTWGDEITDKAVRALAYFFVAIAVYISVRLEWRMAIGALVAVFHDIVLSVGVYSVFRFEVTPATVIAFLTILGYSLYDTIVVYDKVAENSARLSGAARMTYTAMMSLSLNQVMMRSINTTITSIVPVGAMLVVGSLILGAVTLQEFSVALLVGLITGAYSSIFVAAPVVAFLKEREPRNREVRKRLAARGGDVGNIDEAVTPEPAVATVATGGGVGSRPPRPRKKRGKKRR